MDHKSDIVASYPIERKSFFLLVVLSLTIIAICWNYTLYTFSLIVALAFFFLTLKYPEIGLAIIINGLFLIGIFWKSFEIPYFVTPAATILCALALLRYISRRGLNWKFGMIPGVVVLLGGALFCGIFYSPTPEWAMMKTVKYLTYNVFIFFGILLFTGDLEKFKSLLKTIAFLGFIFAIIGIFYVHFTGLESISRFTLPGQNPIWFARNLGLSLICTLFLLETTKKRLNKTILLIFVLMMLFVIYLTASRGPALSLLISLFFYFFVIQKGWSNFFKKLLYVFLIFSSLKLFIALAPKTIWERMHNLFSGSDLTFFLRLNAYKTAYKLFLQNPLIGIGTGGYTDYDKLLRYPHNIILEVACEHGIFILSIFLIFIVYNLYLGIRLLKQKELPSDVRRMLKIFLVLFLFALINSQVSGAVYGNSGLWFASAGIWAIFSTQNRIFQKK
jgi:O-antigen ligase